jgi:hypothetical protein
MSIHLGGSFYYDFTLYKKKLTLNVHNPIKLNQLNIQIWSSKLQKSFLIVHWFSYQLYILLGFLVPLAMNFNGIRCIVQNQSSKVSCSHHWNLFVTLV